MSLRYNFGVEKLIPSCILKKFVGFSLIAFYEYFLASQENETIRRLFLLPKNNLFLPSPKRVYFVVFICCLVCTTCEGTDKNNL